MLRSPERKTIPDGSVSYGRNQGVRGRSEPPERRLAARIGCPTTRFEINNAARMSAIIPTDWISGLVLSPTATNFGAVTSQANGARDEAIHSISSPKAACPWEICLRRKA